jgi:hypothetical protein
MSADAETMRRLAALPRRAYPWAEIREQYVHGYELGDGRNEFPTLKALADRVGVPPARVRAASSREKWAGKRAAHQQALERERHRQRAATIARQAELVDDSALTACLAGMKLIADRLGEIEAVIGRTDADGVADDVPFAARNPRLAHARNPRLAHARELVALSRAAMNFHTVGLRISGAVPTLPQEEAVPQSPEPGKRQVWMGGGSVEVVGLLLAESRETATSREAASPKER